MNAPLGSRDVALAREAAENALREYAAALRFWNAPDDEHTRIQLRRLTEDAIEEEFARASRRSLASAQPKGLQVESRVGGGK